MKVKAPNASRKINRMILWLTLQLFASFAAVGSFVYIFNDQDFYLIYILLGSVIGLLLTINLGYTLSIVARSLIRLRNALPVDERVHKYKFGPLQQLMNWLGEVDQERKPVTDLRQTLIRQTSEAAAQEVRNRLARDLHDSIKQQIFSIHVSAAAVQARWDHDEAGAKQALIDVRQCAKEALAEMNALLQQLSPAPLERVGLVQALKDQCEALQYRSGANVLQRIDELPDDDQFPIGAQEAVFRIAQEGLSNVARHARAQNVFFHLRQNKKKDHLLLDIRDNGKGYDTGAMASGMGLVNMRQRIESFNGRLITKSELGKGTFVRAILPLSDPIASEKKVAAPREYKVSRMFGVGLIGGILLFALLYYPLYYGIPAWFLNTSKDETVILWLVLLCSVIAPFFVMGIGYLAARLARAGSRFGNMLVGSLAGGVAGTVLFYGLGSAVAAVSAIEGLLRNPLTDILPYTYGTFWGLLLVCTLLGTFGGAFGPPAWGERYSNWVHWRITIQQILTAVAVISSLSLLVSQIQFRVVSLPISDLLPIKSMPGDALYPLLTSSVFYFGALLSGYILLKVEIRTPELSQLTFAYTRAFVYFYIVVIGSFLQAVILFRAKLLSNYSLQVQILLGIGTVASILLGGLILRLGLRARRRAYVLGLRRPTTRELWSTAALIFLLLMGIVFIFANLRLATLIVFISALIIFCLYLKWGGRHQIRSIAEHMAPIVGIMYDGLFGAAVAISLLVGITIPSVWNSSHISSFGEYTTQIVVENVYTSQSLTLVGVIVLALIMTGISMIIMRGLAAFGRRQLRGHIA